MVKNSEQHLQHHQPMRQKSAKNKKKPLKITYISTPTMFRAANASEFRAIVQELTGKDSKVTDAWDFNEEAIQVPARFKIDSESVDDVFSSYTSSSVEMEDSLLWKQVCESFFEFQSRVFA